MKAALYKYSRVMYDGLAKLPITCRQSHKSFYSNILVTNLPVLKINVCMDTVKIIVPYLVTSCAKHLWL